MSHPKHVATTIAIVTLAGGLLLKKVLGGQVQLVDIVHGRLEDLLISVELLLKDLLLGLPAFTNVHQVMLQGCSQVRFGHGVTHGVISLHQGHGQLAGHQLVPVLGEDVLPALDGLDVLSMCGVSPYPMLVHQGDQISLCQQPRRLSGTVEDVDRGWLELSSLTVVNDLLV